MITRNSIQLLDANAAPRPRGRPRAAAPLEPISIRFAAADHDRIIAAANARGLSVSEFCRCAVRSALRPDPK
jgi:hypothetical protein